MVIYSNFYEKSAIYFTDKRLEIYDDLSFENEVGSYSNLSIRRFVFGDYQYRTDETEYKTYDINYLLYIDVKSVKSSEK